MNDMVLDPNIENVEAWSGKTRGDENFPVGSRLIARRVRLHMHAFYNFARNAVLIYVFGQDYFHSLVVSSEMSGQSPSQIIT